MSCKRKTIENLHTITEKVRLDSGTVAGLPLSYTNDTDMGDIVLDYETGKFFRVRAPTYLSRN